MEALAKQEKIKLLQMARKAIKMSVCERRLEIEKSGIPALEVSGGAFVTLHLEGELRGCIGRIQSFEPIEKVVQEMAMAAALRDLRFRPVGPEEVDDLEIEISILTPLREIHDIGEIEVGRDGLVVSDRGFSGLLLPQVATEQNWDRETFLSHTCSKAGLPFDYWKNAEPKIEAFSADVFSEKKIGLI